MSVVSFEDSDVVRSAIRVEGFRDDEFNYQLIRALGVADYGGSTVGECLAVAAEIADGSPQSWARAFDGWPSGSRTGAGPASTPAIGSAGATIYLRASTYYRTAEYYADGSAGVARDRRAEPGLLRRAAGLLDPPVELIDVPFEGARSPGYLVPAGPGGGADGARARP